MHNKRGVICSNLRFGALGVYDTFQEEINSKIQRQSRIMPLSIHIKNIALKPK